MKFKTKLLILAIIPLILIGTGVTAISTMLARDAMTDSVQEQLATALSGFAGDVGAFRSQDIDITVFEGDVRVESSIQGAVGTKASQEAVDNVLVEGHAWFSDNANVNGQPYYGYYIPTEGGMLFAGKPQADVRGTLNALASTILLFALAVMGMAGTVMFLIAGRIAKSITEVSRTVGRVAGGDLACDVPDAPGKDEVAAMGVSVKEMVGSLRQVLGQAMSVSDSVMESTGTLADMSASTLQACEEIARAIEDVAQNNTEQAGITTDIQEGTCAMQECMSDIRGSVTRIGNSSDRLTSGCGHMRERITGMEEGSSAMAAGILDIQDKIEKTGKAMGQMSNILESIGDIADQTKLLSLNATIEAARAGDAGRGFGVVADNIRALSTNTATELVEIKGIIAAVTSDFQECMDGIRKVVSDNEGNVESTREVIQSFGAVDSAIQEVSGQISLISDAVRATDGRLSSISGDVMTLGTVSENNAAASEQVNASVEELTALMHSVDGNTTKLSREAEALQGALGAFRL